MARRWLTLHVRQQLKKKLGSSFLERFKQHDFTRFKSDRPTTHSELLLTFKAFTAATIICSYFGCAGGALLIKEQDASCNFYVRARARVHGLLTKMLQDNKHVAIYFVSYGYECLYDKQTEAIAM